MLSFEYKNGKPKREPIKRYQYGDIVLFRVKGEYVQGKIIAVFHSCYMIIADDLWDGRWDDGIFRVGIYDVNFIKRGKHAINYHS